MPENQKALSPDAYEERDAPTVGLTRARRKARRSQMRAVHLPRNAFAGGRWTGQSLQGLDSLDTGMKVGEALPAG
jgi:hypothetical protein